jgi:protein-arginine kinase activator protein McsA
MQKLKACSHCKQEKPINCFSWRNKQKKIRHVICKDCQSKKNKAHYEANIGKYRENTRSRKKRVREEYREKLKEYLSTHPCVDCGETDPIVLTFDHVRGKKKDNVSNLMYRVYPWSIIEKEIAKCQVRCFNCHMRRTSKRQGWGKLEDH